MSRCPEKSQLTSMMSYVGHEPDIVAALPTGVELAMKLIRLELPLSLQAATWA